MSTRSERGRQRERRRRNLLRGYSGHPQAPMTLPGHLRATKCIECGGWVWRSDPWHVCRAVTVGPIWFEVVGPDSLVLRREADPAGVIQAGPMPGNGTYLVRTGRLVCFASPPLDPAEAVYVHPSVSMGPFAVEVREVNREG